MNSYPNPFILERADPYITKGNDGCFYFTASYPAYYSVEKGYDRIILRKSETVLGLAEAKEYTVWKAHNEGEMSRHIWAPELHLINNRWYIFFAAGEKENIWNIRPFVLRCKGSDPINDQWEEMGKMQATAEDEVSFQGFSLDMTYFEHKGEHYVIWAQIIGDSSLFLGKINPNEPWRLISRPMLLTKPEYPWEKVVHKVNEGASVLKTKDRIYVYFSASGTGSEYCMGRVYANSDSDLLDENSWTKEKEPVFETADVLGESGPGHNSFVTDENGQLLLVYHSRPLEHIHKKCSTYFEESLYDPCRHTRIREVKFDEKGVPYFR